MSEKKILSTDDLNDLVRQLGHEGLFSPEYEEIQAAQELSDLYFNSSSLIDEFSLRLASIWLAVGEWGEPKELWDISPWMWHEIALPDDIKKQADIYLKTLSRDIKAEKIKPALTRYIFPSGDIDPERTLVDSGVLDKWLNLYGLDFSSQGIGVLWGDVLQWDIITMHEAVQAATQNAINRVKNPKAYALAEKEAESLTSVQVVEILAENRALRAAQRERPTEQLADSALLLIARALELYQGGEPRRYTQSRFVDDIIEDEKIRGLSKRSINGLLAEANKLLKDKRKE